MPTPTTITLDEALAARVATLAAEAGQTVEEFVEQLLRGLVDGDVHIQLRIANRGHTWWPDAVSPAVVSEVRRSQTARQVTDRYLLGLARRYGGQLITFDRPIAQVGGADAICLLPSA